MRSSIDYYVNSKFNPARLTVIFESLEEIKDFYNMVNHQIIKVTRSSKCLEVVRDRLEELKDVRSKEG